MFRTLLIANRGEIACRIIRSARQLGVRTVAVYSDADAAALHVQRADEAFRIGPAPARDSYLRGDLLLRIAQESGAQAIHPGYGFLSENAAFAQACADAGVVFVGPPAAAIAAMGSKSAAKTLMAQAGVPMLPGYHGADQDIATLQGEADRIGYPLLVKACLGGGGKGMRVVEQRADFPAQLAAARREALASFGDETVLLEKYLQPARHIEVQIFADGQGQAVHLFDRDCSIQRRHQKVLEEAPAPRLSGTLRQAMGDAAIRAALAVGYVGAGTVEFILAAGSEQFYFMEMNTRLQVEHPVTEMITGEDLVAWQLRIASGEALPKTQAELQACGHAIEVRLCAEDPARDFLPATGTLHALHWPETGPQVRVDAGIQAGDRLGMDYDSLLAKLVVWGETREVARLRLCAALQECALLGLTTNLGFLRQLAAHPAFAGADVDTGFIARYRESLLPAPVELTPTRLALLALAECEALEQQRHEDSQRSNDPHSPWWQVDAWQMNLNPAWTLVFSERSTLHPVQVLPQSSDFIFSIGECRITAAGRISGTQLEAILNGTRHRAMVIRTGSQRLLWHAGECLGIALHDPLDSIASEQPEEAGLLAPMPCRVTHCRVAVGQRVVRGSALLVLEAMKMEYTLTAPHDGLVTTIFYNTGEAVPEGARLLELALIPVEARA